MLSEYMLFYLGGFIIPFLNVISAFMFVMDVLFLHAAKSHDYYSIKIYKYLF